MSLAYPLRTGIALSVTAGAGYLACALVFRLWPEQSLAFMNALFHGLDFRRLQGGPALFGFGSLPYSLAVLMVWAFLLGALFGWLMDRLGNAR